MAPPCSHEVPTARAPTITFNLWHTTFKVNGVSAEGRLRNQDLMGIRGPTLSEISNHIEVRIADTSSQAVLNERRLVVMSSFPLFAPPPVQ
ncbi:hypothetical protein BDZ97DRAFT_1920818 [Flammula alnicola]|nr:hypothetical protein BDZ97DRAFT_1920818 [Flammula alnicola]